MTAAMDPNVDLGKLNYTVPMPYNGTIATGGDSLVEDLNVFYNVCLPVLSPNELERWSKQLTSFLSSLVILPGCSQRRPSSCSWFLVSGMSSKK